MPSNEWLRLSDNERSTIERHQQELPVKLSALARDLGLSVRASTLGPSISGELRPDGNGGFVIKVNRHDSSGRQRFTVAHEIAHFLIHRDFIGSGIVDDVLYRSPLSDAREAEANRLAADIIMPERHVGAARLDAIHNEVPDVVEHLANKFGVSDAAMRIRLGLQ